MSRVLIVGAGITGGAINHILFQLLRQGEHRVLPLVTIWESNAQIGGRMTSLSHMSHTQRDRCDIGAQYISQGISGECTDKPIYDHLNSRGVLKLLDDNEVICGMRPEHKSGKHYIAPRGTSSIAAVFLEGANLVTGRKLVKLAINPRSQKFVARTDDHTEEFDVVVMATMAPQLVQAFKPEPVGACDAQNKPNVGVSLPTEVMDRLSSVLYSSRFALAAFYEFSSLEEKARVLASVPWGAKYVLDDDIVRYISLENFKYEYDEDTPSGAQQRHVVSVLVHTSVPFGLAHKDVLHRCAVGSDAEDEGVGADPLQHPDAQAVISAILRSVVQLQILPALASYTPGKVHLVGWEHSQVTRSYHAGAADQVGLDTSRGVLGGPAKSVNLSSSEAPDALVLTVGADGVATLVDDAIVSTGAGEARLPLLVLAGDAFTESNFDGCLKSARFAAQAVASHLLR